MTVRVIDVETTGIDPKTDAIIEIASIDLTPAGYANPIQTFVAPQRAVPPEASAVHHIIDDDLKDGPSLNEAVKLFQGRTCMSPTMQVLKNPSYLRASVPGSAPISALCGFGPMPRRMAIKFLGIGWV